MVPTTKGDGTGSVHNPTECSDIRKVCDTGHKKTRPALASTLVYIKIQAHVRKPIEI